MTTVAPVPLFHTKKKPPSIQLAAIQKFVHVNSFRTVDLGKDYADPPTLEGLFLNHGVNSSTFLQAKEALESSGFSIWYFPREGISAGKIVTVLAGQKSLVILYDNGEFDWLGEFISDSQ